MCSEVKTGRYAVLEEHHPHFLPVCVVHGGVEGNELQFGTVWLQLFFEAAIKHTHVVVGHVGGHCHPPIDPVIHMVVNFVVPVALYPDMQLELGIDQAQQGRGDYFDNDELQDCPLAACDKELSLAPARQLVGLLEVVAWRIMSYFRCPFAHFHIDSLLVEPIVVVVVCHECQDEIEEGEEPEHLV